MAPPSLLGPPELRNPNQSATSQPQSLPASGDPFIDLMVANFNDAAKPPVAVHPPMGYTENCSATFLNSGNPCVDLFFHVVPNTPASYFNTQLPLAWAHNDLTTFKLICNLRGVRGTGKSNKEGFYTAAFWLHKHHPKTLACNVASLAEFGYFKDLPEILYRLLEGEDVRKTQKAEWLMRKSGAGKSSRMAALNPMSVRHGGVAKPPYRRGSKGARESSNWLTVEQSKGARVKRALERTQSEKEKASCLRKEKKVAMAKKAIERYQLDSDFRFLYERVSDLFAECLKSDIENFKVNQYKRINLAAKWSSHEDTLLHHSTKCLKSDFRFIIRQRYTALRKHRQEGLPTRIVSRIRRG